MNLVMGLQLRLPLFRFTCPFRQVGLLAAIFLLLSTGQANAAIIAQGSQVCDTNRGALAAKDTDFTLTSKNQVVIFAGGVNGNNSKLENESSHVWMFRRVGASWADITTSSEVKLTSSTALTHGTSVSGASRRATLGDSQTFVVAGREFETSSSQEIAGGVQGGQITESQVALNFADALDDQEYEFACQWDNDQSPLLIVYPAVVKTPPAPGLWTVINTNDSGAGSLRAAIDYANLNTGTTITFDIPSSDAGYQTDGTDHWWRITPVTALPLISGSNTTIDGSTQTVIWGNVNLRGPEIEIDGSIAGTADGLAVFATPGVSIRDLVINGFDGHAIQINGAGTIGTDVFGCYLGTDAVGESAIANLDYGIWITNGASDTDIGGSGAGQGNLISGNGSSNTEAGISLGTSVTDVRIQGNLIGVDRTAAAAVPNMGPGISISGGVRVTIGGTAAGAGNIIAANGGNGINGNNWIQDINVEGNRIGVGATGLETQLGNDGQGISIYSFYEPSNIVIGGLNPDQGNLIARNNGNGIRVITAGGGDRIEGNVIRDNLLNAIYSETDGLAIVGNTISSSWLGGAAVNLQNDPGTLENNNQIFHNTIFKSGGSGILVAGIGADIRNNIITGCSSYGIEVSTGTMSESHNLITDASTSPANGGGRSNVVLDASDLNVDPLYVDEFGGDFSLTECSSPAINTGLDLGVDQPDLNAGSAGNFNGSAPDMGALESSCVVIVRESAATAVASSGEFVVAWAASGQDGDGWGVYAQRYDAGANPVGGEIQVHGTTTGSQQNPSVALEDNGNFVVAWQTTHVDPSYFNVFAQRFDGNGVKLGGEFRVDAFAGANMQNPAVAMDAAGNFVIAFEAEGNFDGQGAGIYMRWYNSLGVSQGNSRVNATGLGDQTDPAIAMDDVGKYVVVWASDLQDGDARGIYGQRFDSGGNTLGGEFPVNTTTAGDQFDPTVAINIAGDFVVAWTGDDLLSTEIFAQVFAGDGGVLGCELPVNTTTSGAQEAPAVGMAPDGRFTVVWQDGFQEGDNGIYGQSFDPNLATLGGEFRVNPTTPGDQNRPTMGVDAGNRIVVAWDGNGPGGEQIYLDRLAGNTDPFIIVENSTSATATGQSSLTWSHTVGDGADRYLTLGLAFSGGGPGSGTVTYGGVPMSSIFTLSNQNAVHVQLWGLTAPPSGTADIVVSLPSPEDFAAGATSYFGVDQSVPYSGETASTGTGSPAGQIMTIAQGDLRVSVLAFDNGPVLAPLSCQAERWNSEQGTVTGAFGTAPGTGSPETMSWEVGGNNRWVMASAALKPALGLGFDISGIVFEDADFAGTATEWDGGVGDMSLSGVDVELYTSGDGYLASTMTDATGGFSFANLTNGDYKVRVRSATIGDSDTPPANGLHPTVPATWPYPLADMTWGHGSAFIGGQDHLVDDTLTGDNSGPGDTWVSVTISGSNGSAVNLGFSFDLVVNDDDDLNADDVRSKQGCLRQFIKNSNAIMGVNKSWFQIP